MPVTLHCRVLRKIVSIGLICFTLFSACGNDDESGENGLVDAEDTGNISDGRIVFVSNRDGDEQIYLMNADGTDVVKLTDIHSDGGLLPSEAPDLYSAERTVTHGEFNLYPEWSPGGSQIVFVSTRDGNNEIYVMHADGSDPINLTNNQASDLFPTWSPDGSRIAFVSGRDGNAEIYVMNADGSNLTNITNHPGNDTMPSWTDFARNK